jgi:hypothetical protein
MTRLPVIPGSTDCAIPFSNNCGVHQRVSREQQIYGPGPLAPKFKQKMILFSLFQPFDFGAIFAEVYKMYFDPGKKVLYDMDILYEEFVCF